MMIEVTLDDKYTAREGRVFLTGTQALVRLPMAQMWRDRAAGLNTATFISGYRCSPLGGYDQQLVKARNYLDPLDITFQPGVNEDLAATAVWGSQQVGLFQGATKDGVLGVWYGKGPGVDRSGDALKHANAAGTAALGGVLAIAGDDHTCKSSSIPHQSDHAFISALIPMLYPSSVQEFIQYGLLGIAMSRYSGCWVGFKVISETVETSTVIDLSQERRRFVLPDDFDMPPGRLNLRWPDAPLVQDERLQEHKGYAALALARANRVNEVTLDTPNARFGIVASGKAYEDVLQALRELGIIRAEATAIGLRLYKVRMPWPLEPKGIRAFSDGLSEVLIVEERREIIENQIKQQLFNWRADVRPRVVGKFDDRDRPFLPHAAGPTVSVVARAIADRLLPQALPQGLHDRIQARLLRMEALEHEAAAHLPPLDRPWNIAIAGVGGSGILTIGAILGMAAHLEGKVPLVMDMAGLAQKGGAVPSHIRLSTHDQPPTAPRIVNGGADVLLAADAVVGASREAIALCDPAVTHAVLNTRLTPVSDFVRNRDFDFQKDAVEQVVAGLVRTRHFHNFSAAAAAVAGDEMAANMMMLGYAWQMGLIPLGRAAIIRAIEMNKVAVHASVSAFDWGRAMAYDPGVISPVPAPDPMDLAALIAHRAAHLTRYQNSGLADRYRSLLNRARTTVQHLCNGDAILAAIARNYAKLLSYKDEYEVARLYTNPVFQAALDDQFTGGYRMTYNLAPPFLPGRAPNGRPKKRAFGGWMVTVFNGLARLKFLRGTWFDPFRYTADRRAERALIAQYEGDIARLPVLTAKTALALMSLPDDIRGFGPVKAKAIDLAAVKRAELLNEPRGT